MMTLGFSSCEIGFDSGSDGTSAAALFCLVFLNLFGAADASGRLPDGRSLVVARWPGELARSNACPALRVCVDFFPPDFMLFVMLLLGRDRFQPTDRPGLC